MAVKKQILIVEDNLLNREMLKAILADQYAVLEAENGLQGLELLQRRKDDIALILLDVMMPVMDGYTMLNKIHADPELSLIPVIVTTQSDSETGEIAALERGATDFVPKPYRPKVILQRIANLISLRENAAIVNQFQYDRLTGLYSKEFFYKRAREQMCKYPDRSFTMICSNIENFKLFNDVFGVSAGDRLLKESADLFRKLRTGEEVCGRFGADRFLLLRMQEQRTEDYEFLVEAEQEMLSNMKNTAIRWGIYEVTDPTVSVEKMCDRALLAADSIKGQYNRHFAIYDDALRSKLLREQVITESMETALKEKQFSVYLQPKFKVKNDCLVGAEALIRWEHPQLGFLSPGEFIPLFEKNGFITKLDYYVWEQVCILLHQWEEKGYPAIPVSVNVSRADIYQLNLTDTMLDLIHRYKVDPTNLHLEITESAYTENPEQIISTVDQLRELGFIIEMDDFGSGYSSLNMLNQMKLDVLKLDMKFIQSETAKPLEQGIIRFIVELARWMNLSVVAEGVETREQLDRLRDIGCDYVQGYFFAKPMPAVKFETFLASKPVEA